MYEQNIIIYNFVFINYVIVRIQIVATDTFYLIISLKEERFLSVSIGGARIILNRAS